MVACQTGAQNLGQRNLKPFRRCCADAVGWYGAEDFAGVAAVIISGVALLAGVRPVVPVKGVVVAAMLGASIERLKLRVETLEKKPGVAVAVEGSSCGARCSAQVEICGRSCRLIHAT